MAYTVSPYFSDELLESNLRCFFDYEDMFTFDFRTVFNNIVDRDVDFYLEVRGCKFSIDKFTGEVVLL